MRKKELKSLFKETMQTKIPDITSRIDLQSIVIEPKPSTYRLSLNVGLKLATVFLLIIMIAFGVLSTNDGSSTVTPITLSAETTSSFTALSSSVLMNAKTADSSISSNQILLSTSMRPQSTTMMNDRVALLNPYFNMIELFLVEDKLMFSDPVISDLVRYDFMIAYQMVDLAGVIQTYTYYFTETQIGNETMINGLLKLSNVAFHLEGTKVETLDKEVLTLITYLDPQRKSLDYIETMSEKTVNEQKFIYHIFENGDLREKSELKLESEDKKVKIKLKYENETSNESVEIEAIRMVLEGKAMLRIKYEIETDDMDESGEMMVFVQFNSSTNTNEYRYEIKNTRGGRDETSGTRRNSDDDDDDDEEDEKDDDDEEDENDDFPGPRN